MPVGGRPRGCLCSVGSASPAIFRFAPLASLASLALTGWQTSPPWLRHLGCVAHSLHWWRCFSVPPRAAVLYLHGLFSIADDDRVAALVSGDVQRVMSRVGAVGLLLALHLLRSMSHFIHSRSSEALALGVSRIPLNSRVSRLAISSSVSKPSMASMKRAERNAA